MTSLSVFGDGFVSGDESSQNHLADALLLDLQSTTSHIQNLQNSREQESREATPPPIPPHPQGDDMYNHGEPLYEPQTIKQPMHSTTTLVTKVNSPMATTGQRSSLSNNMSELDTLLQDLSSAQFMAEVDRRNSGTANGFQNEEMITPTKHAPVRETIVDSLLEELERQDSVPNNSYRHDDLPSVPNNSYRHDDLPSVPNNSYRNDDLPNHYEQVNIPRHPNAVPMATTSHAVQHYSHQAGSHPGTAGPPGASTATRELDDLMASLSEFKMGSPAHVGEPPYAQPNKGNRQQPGQFPQQQDIVQTAAGVQSNANIQMATGVPSNAIDGSAAGGPQSGGNLEAMLGNLSTDMSKQGVMTVPKGHCAACSKPIIGQVITALGRIWHPEHFTCSHCKSELGTRNFFERDGLPFCERDYHMLFSPRCASCNGPILDKCITALEKSWHPEHFVCAHCKRPFGEDGFHERDGLAYCRDDYFEMFAPKCGGCNRPIMDNYISALNKQWHPECFICWECHTPFGASSFFDHEGFPFCETHYHAKRGSLCAGCQEPIKGRCITAMYKKFHPEHFVCAFCLKQLNKGTFKEQNDKPYCHPCFVKLFG